MNDQPQYADRVFYIPIGHEIVALAHEDGGAGLRSVFYGKFCPFFLSLLYLKRDFINDEQNFRVRSR